MRNQARHGGHTAPEPSGEKKAEAQKRTGNYSFFSHRDCEYFPCHAGADPENFNCLFCYCPFYLLGEACGGQFRYTENGYKDCTGCLYPHRRENYAQIVSRYGEIAAALKRGEKQ